MRVALCSAYRSADPDGFERASFRAFSSSAAANPGGHELEGDPARADVILFSDTGGMPPAVFLARDPRYRRNLARAFVYSDIDQPWISFPGVAPGIPAKGFDPLWHRSGPYVREGLGDWAAEIPFPTSPKHLFSFCGSRSTHPVREAIRSAKTATGLVIESDRATVQRAFETGDARAITEMRGRYVRSVEESHFVLCPRGVAPSSIRMFEVMAMGRAPVILSDEWVEPPGPRWNAISVRVPESDAGDLDRILEPLRERSREMGAAARKAWETWFAPEQCFRRTVESCLAIASGGATGKRREHLLRWRAMLQPEAIRELLRYFRRGIRA